MASRAAATSAASNPKRATESRTVNRWFRVRYLAVAVVLVWALFRFWHVEMPQLSQLSRQQQALQTKLSSLQTQQGHLKTQVKEYQNDAFIAKYASEHLHLVLPGQVPFTVSPSR